METEEEERKKRLLTDVEVGQLREGLRGKINNEKHKERLKKKLKQKEEDLKKLYSEHYFIRL